MTISTSVGPISGIDYGKLIDGLMGVEQQPLNQVNTQLQQVNDQTNTFQSLAAQLTALQLDATSLTSSTTFKATGASSSNSSVLTGTSGVGTAPGSYTFTVQRLATSSQVVSQGFASQTASVDDLGLVSSNSTYKQLAPTTALSLLDGGFGVQQGSIQVTNKNGVATTIDLSRANTIQDVVDTINKAGAGVTASISKDSLVLTDTTGGGGSLAVAEVGTTKTAANLGILQTTGGTTLTGNDINKVGILTSLTDLNNLNGVRILGTDNDFSITASTGQTFNINLTGATTIGDVINKINQATANGSTQAVTAGISADGHALKLTDANGGQVTVKALNGSYAARDLGLVDSTGTGSGTGQLVGQRINYGLNSALVSELNDGTGIGTGSFTITARDGTASTINIDSSVQTVQDVIDTINSQATGVTAALSADKLGITLTDTTGGSANDLTVADASGTVASNLGLAGSSTTNTLDGTSLDLRTMVAGKLTFQLGKGRLDDVMSLADLNGGKGVGRGSIRVTDSTGAVGVIDLSSALDLNDVVNTINNTTSLNLSAAIDNDHLVITDHSGGAGALTIANVGSGTTATDLGLTVPTSNVGGVLTSGDLNQVNTATALASLNSGNGVTTAGASSLVDFTVTASGGSGQVHLYGAKTLGDVVNAINAAGKVNGAQIFTASLTDHGIQISDAAGAGGSVSVASLNGTAAADLGLLGQTSVNGTLTGTRLNNAANSVQLSQLNGGSGVRLGTIAITNHSGAVTNVDLSGASTVQDVIDTINASGAGVAAGLDSAGTGLELTDTTGLSAGTLSVADVGGGFAATDLGLAQTTAAATLDGSDLHLKVMGTATQLSTLNGGTGFKAGSFTLYDGDGHSATVDLSGNKITTLGDVINAINTAGTNIRASINANGNGLLLTDSSTLGGAAKVQEANGGTTATSLNIAGSFTGNTLDGSFQKSVTVLTTDTLQTLASKITSANVGVAASVVNDGSASAPFRLSLSSRNSGLAGRLVFDGSSLGLNTQTLVDGQDAAVTFGTGTGLQTKSGTNTLTSLVPGLTLNLTGTGTATVTVSRDTSQVDKFVQSFVDDYNKVVNAIADATKFDVNDPTNRGVLFGDSTVQQIQAGLGDFVSRIFSGVGQIRTFGGVGLTIQQDGTLQLDTSKLDSMLSTNYDDVQKLFSTAAMKTTDPDYDPNVGGIGAMLSSVVNKFTDAQTGIIFQTTDALATKMQQLTQRATDLNTLLNAKQNQLINTFANLEVTIAQLQSQGSALSSFTSGTSSSSTKSSSSG